MFAQKAQGIVGVGDSRYGTKVWGLLLTGMGGRMISQLWIPWNSWNYWCSNAVSDISLRCKILENWHHWAKDSGLTPGTGSNSEVKELILDILSNGCWRRSNPRHTPNRCPSLSLGHSVDVSHEPTICTGVKVRASPTPSKMLSQEGTEHPLPWSEVYLPFLLVLFVKCWLCFYLLRILCVGVEVSGNVYVSGPQPISKYYF